MACNNTLSRAWQSTVVTLCVTAFSAAALTLTLMVFTYTSTEGFTIGALLSGSETARPPQEPTQSSAAQSSPGPGSPHDSTSTPGTDPNARADDLTGTTDRATAVDDPTGPSTTDAAAPPAEEHVPPVVEPTDEGAQREARNRHSHSGRDAGGNTETDTSPPGAGSDSTVGGSPNAHGGAPAASPPATSSLGDARSQHEKPSRSPQATRQRAEPAPGVDPESSNRPEAAADKWSKDVEQPPPSTSSPPPTSSAPPPIDPAPPAAAPPAAAPPPAVAPAPAAAPDAHAQPRGLLPKVLAGRGMPGPNTAHCVKGQGFCGSTAPSTSPAPVPTAQP